MTHGPLLIPALVALALGACAPRAAPPSGDRGAHGAHGGVLLEPPFSLAVTPRALGLEARVTARHGLGGTIVFTLEGGAGAASRRVAPARTGTIVLPSRAGPWRVTATWRDPSGVMGATATVDSIAPPDPRPAFAPVGPIHVGALRVDAAIPVGPLGPPGPIDEGGR
ncbi:MAG: hypothetical protein IT385_10950 [Deltaproteobacteria bacterium]|nr:hypothetical protein [Deltaproteobacteria bacterium]